MDILVLGGTGFLSAALASELQVAGHRVTLFTRGRRPLPPGIPAITGDRTDPDSFLRCLEGRPFDAVIDCLCYEPRDAVLALRAFTGRVRRYVMVSTDQVYGFRRPFEIDEDTTPRPANERGRQKLRCEELLRSAGVEEGFPVTVLRLPHVVGAGGHLGTGSLTGRDPMLLDRLAQGAPIVLLDGGSLLIQPVYHRDVGKACAAVLESPQSVGQVYHVAGPDRVTTREYFDLIAAVLGVASPHYVSLPNAVFVQTVPERAPLAQHRTFSVEKLAAHTGYRPVTPLPHALIEMVDWLQATGGGQPYAETQLDRALAELYQVFQQELGRALAEAPSTMS